MRELSLFSGGGGGLLATRWLLGWQTIGYVEINDYCQRIIQQRIRDGLLDEAPIFGDIRAFIDQGYAERYRGMVDVITAGFPCQPFSVSGKRKGKDDNRNMWPQTIECIRMVRPKYTFLENVPGLLTSGYIGTVLGDLAESGYDCRWRCLSAAELGAPHQRKRLWIIAYTHQFDDNDGRYDPGAIFGERSQTTDIFDTQSKQTGENEQGMGSETRQVSDTTSDRCNSGRQNYYSMKSPGREKFFFETNTLTR